MRVETRETTTTEVWVLLDDVIAEVKSVGGPDERTSDRFIKGWEAACKDIVTELEDIRESA